MVSHSRLIGLATASMIALTSLSAPAMALGKKERNILAGIAAAVVIGQLLDNNKAQAAPQNPPHRPPLYDDRRDPRYDPRYDPRNDPRHDRWNDRYYEDRKPQPPRGPSVNQNSIYNTPLAAAFKSYGSEDRRRIQRRLQSAGYYAGSIDGAFGPRSYEGMVLYARAMGYGNTLNTSAGAYGFLDRILR